MNPAIYGSLPSDACTLGTTGNYGPDRISQIVYDADSRPIQLKVAVGTSDAATERTLTYSDNGKVTSLKDGEANLTTYEYDGFDRLAKTRYPVTTKGGNASSTTDYEQLGYDANSNVTSFRNRAGSSIAFTYDNLNRVTLKDLPSPEGDVSYSYDLLDRNTGASQGGYNLSFSYDALSRQTSDGQGWGTISRSFDLAGRMIRTTWQDGFYVDYDRLVTGELWEARENGASSGVGVLATYGYDDLRRRTSVTFGNGATQAFSYDAVSRLASLTNDLSGTANDLTKTFAYNPASQIVSETRSNDAYAFHPLNESTTTVTNGLNQLSTVGGVAAAYDANGNLTTDPSTAKTYAYDSENKLKTASGGVSVYYDPVGRIAEYDTNVSSRFMSDGSGVVVQLDGSSTITGRFVRGDGPDELIAWYTSSDPASRNFAHLDERNSVIAVTNSAGAVTVLNRYDEYGTPQNGNYGPFQYTGQMWLGETGTYHYKARNYLPSSGVFPQTDPIRFAGGINLYGYTGNDPVNFADPMGLDPIVICVPFTYWDGAHCLSVFGGGIPAPRAPGEPTQPNGCGLLSRACAADTDDPLGHSYPRKGRLCTVTSQHSCKIERTRSEMCVLPGHTSKNDVVSGALYGVTPDYGEPIPIGVVRTIQNGPYSYRNTTTWAHPFAGTVDIRFTQDRAGNINYSLYGQGFSIVLGIDTINQILGPLIFTDQLSLCSAYVGGK